MVRIVRIGRKYAIYLPRPVVKSLDLKEGDRLILEIRGDEIVFKKIPKLLKKRNYWSDTTVEDFETESEELIDLAEGEQH